MQPGRGPVLGIQLRVLPGPAFHSAPRRRTGRPRALHRQRRLGCPRLLGGIGFVQIRAQPEAAVATYERAIPLARATGQRSEVVMGCCRKAYALIELGRLREALVCTEQAEEAAGEEMGWLWGTTFAWQVNGMASLLMGDMAPPASVGTPNSSSASGWETRCSSGFGERLLGEVAKLRGDFRTAKEAVTRGRAVNVASGARSDLPIFDTALALVELSLGHFDRAYKELDAATAEWEALGFSGARGRALLAEVAVKRGDLRSCPPAHRPPRLNSWWEELTRKGPSRCGPLPGCARAEGRPQKALALACQALETSFSTGALLAVIEPAGPGGHGVLRPR